jgi:molybdopterin-synthase adenylyltransferase
MMQEEALLSRMSTLAREESCEGGPALPTLSEEQLRSLSRESGKGMRDLQIFALRHGITPARYLRNYRELSFHDQERMLSSSVGLAGLGGLGGHLLDALARLGVGRIAAADGDVFEECNLNRQLLSSQETMGLTKAEAARRRVASINPAVEIEATALMLDRQGFCSYLGRVDVLFDALGGVAVKKLLLECGRSNNVPVITAAVAGWSCIVTTVLPGQTAPPDFFGDGRGAEQRLGCLAPAIGVAAAVQCSEGIRILCGKGATLAGKMLAVDLSRGSFEVYEF